MTKSMPESSTLAEHLARRNRCRYGLGGVSVRCDDGDVHVISHTYWDKGSKLVIVLENEDRVSPEDCVLVSKWPVVCCKPRRAPSRPAMLTTPTRMTNLAASSTDRS